MRRVRMLLQSRDYHGFPHGSRPCEGAETLISLSIRWNEKLGWPGWIEFFYHGEHQLALWCGQLARVVLPCLAMASMLQDQSDHVIGKLVHERIIEGAESTSRR